MLLGHFTAREKKIPAKKKIEKGWTKKKSRSQSLTIFFPLFRSKKKKGYIDCRPNGCKMLAGQDNREGFNIKL